MRIPHLSLVALTCLIAQLSIAEEPAFRVVMPAETTLRLHGPDVPQSPHQLAVDFEGQITIRAKYRFMFEEERRAEPVLLLFPDQESISSLPHITRPGTGWVAEKAEKIWVTNIEDAAAALLTEEMAAQVLAGRLPEVIGEADIVGDEFSAGYECDVPSFTIKFVRIGREILHARISERTQSSGC